MQEFKYLKPVSLKEAVELLSKYKKSVKILAGGTDLIIALRDRLITCSYVMDIKSIKELNVMECTSEGLCIGASVNLNDIIASNLVTENYSILNQSAKVLANSLLRNRATLVGNLCNASPGGDMLSPSIVLEGEVETASVDGTKRIPLNKFFTGVKRTALKDNEMVTKVIFPHIKGEGIYKRRSRIKGHDLSQVAVAAFLKEEGGLNISIGAAGPIPVIVNGFDGLKKADLYSSKDRIIEKIIKEIKPIGDQRASKEYRIAMVEYLARQSIEELGR